MQNYTGKMLTSKSDLRKEARSERYEAQGETNPKESREDHESFTFNRGAKRTSLISIMVFPNYHFNVTTFKPSQLTHHCAVVIAHQQDCWAFTLVTADKRHGHGK